MNHPEPLSNKESLRGSVIGGKYIVEELLGSGGMGTVWMGRHQILKTRVAIKFIRPQFAERHEARRRFEIEARAAANVSSKHAVQVYDYGVSDFGLPYIVMEYLEGESLSDTLMRVGPFPPMEVAKVIAQAARALSKAHGVGIVHRDLKPDNIFLATNAEDADSDLPYVVKLVDFGIAKMFDYEKASDSRGGPLHGPTQDGAVVGTPNFMSPEQLTVGGAPGPLTDLWALGACAFTAMTARLPFEGEVLGDIVLKVCVAPMPVPSQYNPSLPPGFDAWFAKACARDPEHRFQTVAELSESLMQVCGGPAPRMPAPSHSQMRIEQPVRYELKKPPPGSEIDLADLEVPRGMSSRTAFAAGVLLVVTIVFGMVGVLAWRSGTPSAPASTTAGH